MRLAIQSATIERTYSNAQTSTRRVTLNGDEKGEAFRIGETLPEWHFWAGWKVTAATDCGSVHSS